MDGYGWLWVNTLCSLESAPRSWIFLSFSLQDLFRAQQFILFILHSCCVVFKLVKVVSTVKCLQKKNLSEEAIVLASLSSKSCLWEHIRPAPREHTECNYRIAEHVNPSRSDGTPRTAPYICEQTPGRVDQSVEIRSKSHG